MIKKENKKSLFLIIGSFLILIGIVAFSSKYIYDYIYNKSDEEKINKFFKQEKVINDNKELKNNDQPSEETQVIETDDYIGVLEIPTIDFKRGFLNIKDKNNNLGKNIEILQNSDMPDVENGLMVIAGHSGSGRIAFFKNLHKVKVDQEIYIYYKNIKYVYKVVDNYEVKKNGVINLARDNSNFMLVLTTCSQQDEEKQIIVISKLVNKSNY